MNELTVFRNYLPSTSGSLNEAMVNLSVLIWETAEANVDAAGYDLTATEREAVVTVQALKEVNGLDLAAVLMRGALIRKIREGNLLAIHPGEYTTLDAMAKDQGISITELYHVIDLTDIIFPYLQETLGMDIARVWEEVGRSNMKELAAVLKSIITGDDSSHRVTRESVELILDDTAATLRATAEANAQEIDEDNFDNVVRRNAVAHLIEQGELLTNAQLRQHVRPSRTPHFNAAIITLNGARYVVTQLDEDQWTYFNRQVGGRMDPIFIELPENPRLRQAEVMSIPEVRSLLRLLED